MIPQDVLKALANDQGVSDNEFEVLTLVMDGYSITQIATKLEIKPDAVRKRLGEVYKKFQIGGSGPGKLAKLQQNLVSSYQSHSSISLNEIDVAKGKQIEGHPPDWGDAIDVETTFFYGRKDELEKLETWILQDRCRLIAILGIGGIGKTTLSLALARQIQTQFERVIWRSLSHTPSLKELLADLLKSFSKTQVVDLKESVGDRISQLLNYLEEYRCLLILDGVEAILKDDDLAGRYKKGYEDYTELLKQVGSKSHQSCLVITSGEKLKEFALLEGRKVRSLLLKGLKGLDTRKIFEERGIVDFSEDELRDINERYAGNPLALKIVSATIQELFGSISEFLKQKTTVFGDIRHLLDHQFERLSPLEEDVMYWLAIYCEPVSLSILREDIVPTVAQAELLEVIESLGYRSLIDTKSSFTRSSTSVLFLLQPVVMEYVINRFIDQICQEIKLGKILRFNSHVLIKAQTKDYLRERQIETILKPLTEKLLTLLDGKEAIEDQLQKLLEKLPRHTPPKPSYATGNVLNLLRQLQINADLQPRLNDRDFSALAIWQAYLSDVNLRHVNFANTDLSKSVFAETMGAISAVTFSPDNKILATGSLDHKIRLWNVETGEQFSWEGHTDWVRSVAFNHNGQWLASTSHDGTIRLWDVNAGLTDVKTGHCFKILKDTSNWLRSVAFGPDDHWLASGGDDSQVRLWNVKTGQYHYLKGHKAIVRSVTFSPNGQLLASGSSDCTIKVWDFKAGTCLVTLKGHSRGVRSVAFSPNGQLLASGSSDKTIKLWDVSKLASQAEASYSSECSSEQRELQCLSTLADHIGWVWSVAFNKEGQVLASASGDHTIKLWDMNTGECFKTLENHMGWVRSVAFSPNDQWLASGSDDQTVRLWNAKTGERLKTFQGYARGVRSVAFSRDRRRLVSGSDDWQVRLWDITSTGNGDFISLAGHTGLVWSVAFSPNDQLIASGSEDLTIRIWDVNTGRCLKKLEGHQDGVLSVAFSGDGRLLASGSSDRTIKLWDVRTWECLDDLKGHTGWVWSVAFNPQTSMLASGSGDMTVRLWDISTGELVLEPLKGHSHWLRSVAFSADGKILASSSVGRNVRLWDVETGQLLKTLPGHRNGVRSLAFSPDQKILASGGADHTIRLWRIDSEQFVPLQGHSSRVRSVAFSADGAILASGSNDETIKLWNIETHQELMTLKVAKPYEGMIITGAKGISESQRTTLLNLGAIDEVF
ncbi:MAG: NB-ARC domain-containing protein [Oculatellaceae cyanobacterium bins.114]|nr:NB-ARC domain-containing protein [Oculatellaceae cyanobacterium bins.114]